MSTLMSDEIRGGDFQSLLRNRFVDKWLFTVSFAFLSGKTRRSTADPDVFQIVISGGQRKRTYGEAYAPTKPPGKKKTLVPNDLHCYSWAADNGIRNQSNIR